jgi:hypothetical protein
MILGTVPPPFCSKYFQNLFRPKSDRLLALVWAGQDKRQSAAAILRACEIVQTHLSTGRNRAGCHSQVCAWLWKHGPPMGDTEEALGRNLYRKCDRWATTRSIADQRRESNKARRAPKLSLADRDTLIGCAVFNHEGDLDAAWTDCAVAGKLSAGLLARYPLPTDQRPRCPKAVRRQVAAEIATLMPWHRGPRQARLNGA